MVATHAKQILNSGVNAQEEALRVGWRSEASHLTLPLSGRLMRDLGTVVRVWGGVVHDEGHEGLMRDTVAAQLIGDDACLSPFKNLRKDLCAAAPSRRG